MRRTLVHTHTHTFAQHTMRYGIKPEERFNRHQTSYINLACDIDRHHHISRQEIIMRVMRGRSISLCMCQVPVVYAYFDVHLRYAIATQKQSQNVAIARDICAHM